MEVRLLRRKEIWRTACERDELLLAEVWPDVLGGRRKKNMGEACVLVQEKGKHNQEHINYLKKYCKYIYCNYLYAVPICIILMTSSAVDTYTSSRPTT